MGLKIGELARRTGVNVQTVRYYERRGILAEPPRTDSGYRQYRPEAVRRIRFIKRAQRLGFTLREIDDLLGLRVEGPGGCAAVEARTSEKLEEVESRLRELDHLRRVLEGLLSACRRHEPTAECPVLEVLEEGDDGI